MRWLWWKHIKIKFYSGDELPLNKTAEIPVMIIVVTAIFYGNNKYYAQVFLDEFRYEIWNNIKVLHYDRIEFSGGFDFNKTSASKEWDICHYWYFSNHSFKFQPNVCNDLLMMSINLSHIAILNMIIAVLLV